jgi:hypothetical protein
MRFGQVEVRAITALLVIERFLTRKFFQEPEPDTVSQIATE